ncbi:MAG: hypothetical protein I4N51_21365 [Acinetobacter sp.]|nr:hypothetical protein [Acinetobacter sp.]
MKLLTQEINFLFKKINSLESFVNDVFHRISNLPNFEISCFNLNRYILRDTLNIRNRHNKKFQNLLLQRPDFNSDGVKEVPFLNFSSVVFNPEQQELLGKGPKYVPSNFPKKENLVFKLENIIKHLPSELL